LPSEEPPEVSRSTSVRGVSLVDRPALLATLDRAAESPVTVISAPAGSGKTMLIRAWVAAQRGAGRHIGELSVSRGEEDDQRFWRAVIDAWSRALGRNDRAAPTPAPGFDGDALVERLLADGELLEEPLVLVIDDLHELTSSAALEQLTRLISCLPPHLHLILATRRDPRLGLHRLRVLGELTEIRGEDLRFSREETRQLLSAVGVALSDTGLSRLHDRTEGWVAGLRLAATALEAHPDPERFVAEFSGSDRTVAEYLFAEMLEAEPTDVRELLLSTSVLERISGPLADAVLASSGSEEILHRLHASSGFVLAVDSERRWFRYHHLLSDLLRLELRRRAPESVRALHRRAVEWFEAHEQFVEAIEHALHAEDWPGAARLIADHAFELTLDGENATLHRLVSAFPAAEIRQNPELAVVVAADRLARGSLGEAERYLGQADEQAGAVASERRTAFDTMREVVALDVACKRADFVHVPSHTEALTRGMAGEDFGAVSDDIRAYTVMNLGIAEAWSMRFAEAEVHLREGAALAKRIDRPYVEVACLAHLSFTAHDQVRDRAETALSAAARHGWEAEPVVAPALVSAAGLAAWRGQLDRAEDYLARARELVRPDAEPAIALYLHEVAAMTASGRGRLREAVQAFQTSEQLNGRLRAEHPLFSQIRSYRMQIQARLGEVAAARTSLQAMTQAERRLAPTRVAEAALLNAEADFEGSLASLAPVLDGRIGHVHRFNVAFAHLHSAVAHDGLGDRGSAERSLEAVLELAEPEGLIAPFMMVDARSLLERHPRYRTAHGKLLDDILDVLRGRSSVQESSADEVAEPLTASEKRVLGYLASNLSTGEIGSELYLSINTIKVHIRHIYGKLGVHNRTEAVQRARELRLIAGGRR
jgi:LuxR family transcriptional regulator, maltose regulon positive regulatory protein